MTDFSEFEKVVYQTTLNFINYWFNYVETNELSHTKLGLEIPNILNALQKASVYSQNEQLISITHKTYPFFESQGMFNQIETYLLHAQLILNEEPSRNGARNLLMLGRLSFRQENFDKAKTYWTQGQAFAKVLKCRKLQAELEMELGILAMEKRDFNKARKSLVCAMNMAKPFQDQHLTCKIYGELCRLYYYIEQTNKARYYCAKGLSIAYELEDGHLVTGLLVYRGAFKHTAGKLEEAFDIWYEALDLARKVGILERNVVLLANLGTVSEELGRLKDAKKYLDEGIKVARLLGNTQVLSHQLMDLGLLYGKQENYKKAKKLFKESMVIAKESEHVPLITYNLLKKGDFYLMHKPGSALKAYEECISFIAPEESVNYLQIRRATAQFGAAKALHAVGEMSKAAQFCEQSMSFWAERDYERAEEVRKWAERFLS